MASMDSFSICIPTYNRSGMLSECLQHLLEFSDQRFEVVVGNNASADDTEEVIQSFAPRFQKFKSIRHPENLGFARNMDAILRLATHEFIYILSDDDFVFEEVFDLVRGAFQTHPQAVAVAGKYIGVRKFDVGARIDYSNAVASVLPQQGFDVLLQHYMLCDGHPFMRREIFQRHCAYGDRVIGLFPLFMRLLCFGSVLVIDKPFFQHIANEESLTGSMTEAWMLDMANADFELALSMPQTLGLRDKLAPTREHFLQLMYFQAARMAFTRSAFSLMWLFLRRLRGVQGGSEGVFLGAEHAFIHEVLVQRVAQIVTDAGFSAVVVDDSPICQVVAKEVSQLLPAVHFTTELSEISAGGRIVWLCPAFKPELGAQQPSIALSDLFDQLRLTPSQGALVLEQSRVSVHYEDMSTQQKLKTPDQGFQVLCSRYATN